MELVNPNTRTVVTAEGEIANRLIAVGFKPVEAEPDVPVRRGPGRPKKK